MLRLKPCFSPFAHKIIIIQPRICAIHSVNLFTLAGAQRFVGIQAPDALEQTLSAQDFMKTGDTAGELVCSIEKLNAPDPSAVFSNGLHVMFDS